MIAVKKAKKLYKDGNDNYCLAYSMEEALALFVDLHGRETSARLQSLSTFFERARKDQLPVGPSPEFIERHPRPKSITEVTGVVYDAPEKPITWPPSFE